MVYIQQDKSNHFALPSTMCPTFSFIIFLEQNLYCHYTSTEKFVFSLFGAQ